MGFERFFHDWTVKDPGDMQPPQGGDTQKSEDKVDASDLKLTDMGSQGGEKGGKGAPNGMPNNSEQQSKPSE